MEENGCNFLSYQIDSAPISEGFILAKVGTSFQWVFTERGVKRVEKVFDCESDAVVHAYTQIKDDSWAWSHLVGFIKDQVKLTALKKSLQRRGIHFYDDMIPYGGKDDVRYRVYVHGCKAEAVADLQRVYGR